MPVGPLLPTSICRKMARLAQPPNALIKPELVYNRHKSGPTDGMVQERVNRGVVFSGRWVSNCGRPIMASESTP